MRHYKADQTPFLYRSIDHDIALKQRKEPPKKGEKATQRQTWQGFLSTFFDTDGGYADKEVNGFHLRRVWNGQVSKWIIQVYSPEAYKKAQQFLDGINTAKDAREAQEHNG